MPKSDEALSKNGVVTAQKVIFTFTAIFKVTCIISRSYVSNFKTLVKQYNISKHFDSSCKNDWNIGVENFCQISQCIPMGIFWKFVTLLWPWPTSNVYQKLMVTIPPRGAAFCKVSGSLDQNCGRNRVSKNRRHTYIHTYIHNNKQTQLTNILRKIFFFEVSSGRIGHQTSKKANHLGIRGQPSQMKQHNT